MNKDRFKAAAACLTLMLAACGAGDDPVLPALPDFEDSPGVLGSPVVLGSLGVMGSLGASPRFTEVVAFGDGMTDGGTYNPTTFIPEAPPAPESATGLAYTTKPGKTWTGYVAQLLRLPLGPNQQVDFGILGRAGQVMQLGGLNYAEGGAMLLVDAPNGGIVSQPIPGVGTAAVQVETARSIATQISDYLAEHGNAFQEGQLVLIQGGMHDFTWFLRRVADNPALAASAPTVTSHAVTAMVVEIGRLKAAGATRIVYASLPDLGATPQFRGTPLAALATTLSVNYNAAVASALSGFGVVVLDTQALLAQAVASPAAYGFTNVFNPACNSYSSPGDPSSLSALRCSANTLVAPGADFSYLFADGLHLTSGGHQLLAARALALIQSMP